MENKTILNSSITFIPDTVLNIISALADITALLICFSFLCIIVYRRIRITNNCGQSGIDVSLILSINTLCIIIMKSIMQIIHITIPTIMKDFQIITEFNETSFHRIRAYILWSLIGILYWSYVLLAFFRFVRVIYPKYIWLHRLPLYIYILIPAQFLCIFIILLPLIFGFEGIHLIPNEGYCSIPIKPFHLMAYTSIIIFYLPYITMSIFYVCIARKIRQVSAIRPYQERNRRDFIVIRRMLLNVIILCIVSIPYFIIFIIYLIRNHFDSLIYRIQWLSSSIGSCLFSLILPLITVHLRDLLRRNKLKPMDIKTGIDLKTI